MAMDHVEKPPERLVELPEPTREFLAAMRPEELERLKFLVEEFTKDDLTTISESLENLRSIKRFGRFSYWFLGFIIAGAGAAGIMKSFFFPGGAK
jgi:hypothetical protein